MPRDKTLDFAEKMNAAWAQLATDAGFKGAIVPWWMKQVAMDLYQKGWRRRQGLDPREQKERWTDRILTDMGVAPGWQKAQWIRNLAIRLVESGWIKEE